jgi:hypothetical protein
VTAAAPPLPPAPAAQAPASADEVRRRQLLAAAHAVNEVVRARELRRFMARTAAAEAAADSAVDRE